MHLETIHIQSIPSGRHNEDRAGVCGNVAWVIDGATDLGDEAIVGRHTDAAWFADHLDRWLHANATQFEGELRHIVAPLTDSAAAAFARDRKRPPAAAYEQPSAAGIVVRLVDHVVEYVSLGDCTLLIARGDGTVIRAGAPREDVGDARLAPILASAAGTGGDLNAAERRERLMPHLRAARSRMNTLGGYGIFSVAPPPESFIDHGRMPLNRDDRLLLASDGFMRLVDLYRRYDDTALMAAVLTSGPEQLLAELRRIEQGDADADRFLRAKGSDDATIVLARCDASRGCSWSGRRLGDLHPP